jgi:hypothetical protein
MFFRSATLLLGGVIAGCMAADAAPPPAQVDACKLIDAAAVNSAAKAWLGATTALEGNSAPGARGGSCGFTTESPKHIDFTIFYAPAGNPEAYGLGSTAPPGETPVSGVGDKAVYDQSNDPKDRYKSEEIAVLKGRAVLVFSLTLDKSLAFVPKEKLAEFAAKQFAAKM